VSADAGGLLDYLIAAGVVPEGPGARRAQVVDLSRTHAVFGVTFPDGRGLVVKRARRRPGELTGTLERELAAYALATSCPALAAAMPECVLIDRARQALVLRAVEPGETLRASGLDASGPPPEQARLLGALIAGWQDATSAPPPSGLPTEMPWVLGILTPGRWRPAVADALLVHGVVRRELRARFTALTELIEPSCLVHGDLKWDNCLRDEGEGVRVVDWETAAVGDPAWDVAGIVQEYTVARRATALMDGHPRSERTPASLAAFLEGFCGAVAGDGDAIVERALALAGARLVQTTLEWAAAGTGERASQALLRDALAALRAPARLLEPDLE
jgi:streptomycin 6-kinase